MVFIIFSIAESIPVNLEATKYIGAPNDIGKPMIPLGTSFYKYGSAIG